MTNRISGNSAELAKRSVGAMVFCIFGYLWIMVWAIQSYGTWSLIPALITVAAGGLFLAAFKVYRHNKPALAFGTKDQKQLEQGKRTARIFHLINAGQGFAMLISSNILINLGLSQWVTTAIIFIVGLHFIPLARLFHYVPHYTVGATLMMWALIYPILASGDPSNPLGCLGTGLILWVTSLYGLTRNEPTIGTKQYAAQH